MSGMRARRTRRAGRVHAAAGRAVPRVVSRGVGRAVSRSVGRSVGRGRPPEERSALYGREEEGVVG
jgi:hypothetical protein